MPIVSEPAASRRFQTNIYLLIAGVVIGMAIGPFVLGQISEEAYAMLFPVDEQQEAVDAFQEEAAARLAAAHEVGVTDEYLPELQQAIQLEMAELIAARDAARVALVLPYVLAIVLAVIAVMFIEAIYARPNTGVGIRLATARYALVAIGLALLLATPHALVRISLPFVALLIVVALLTALIPLKASSETAVD